MLTKVTSFKKADKCTMIHNLYGSNSYVSVVIERPTIRKK